MCNICGAKDGVHHVVASYLQQMIPPRDNMWRSCGLFVVALVACKTFLDPEVTSGRGHLPLQLSVQVLKTTGAP